MALKERKAVETYLVCDVCDTDIAMATTATKLVGAASGYMKRDQLEVDLCESCAAKLGLHRRGRPTATAKASEPPKQAAAAAKMANAPIAAPLKRGPGRPRKNPAPLPEPVAVLTEETWGDDE